MKKNSIDILIQYYKYSFPNILGIQFPVNFEIAKKHRSLFDYLDIQYGEEISTKVKDILVSYREVTAPLEKIKPLLSFLETNKISPQVLLDFGSGFGNLFYFLSKKVDSIKEIWAIDPDIDINFSREMETGIEPTKVFFYPTLDSFEMNTRKKFDLIIIIHTLHHIEKEKQEDIINSLVALLNRGGFIYLYEDSWSTNLETFNLHDEFSDRFLMLSEEQKKIVYLENEYWSNTWCYYREINSASANYRSQENWVSLVKNESINIVSQGNMGFNPNRLHGVPSIYLIIKRVK